MNPITVSTNPADAVKGWMSALETIDAPEATPQPATAEPQKEPDGTNDTQQPADHVAVGKPTPAPAPKPAPDPAPRPVEPPKPVDELPEDKWPRTAQEWKKFKEIKARDIKERDEKIKAIEAERDEIKKKISETPVSPELESLKKERDELSERLRILDVERHPKFTAYFQNRTQTQVDLAKRIVGPEYAEKAAKLLSLPDGQYKDSQIEEMLLNLSPLQQSRFGSVLNSLADIEAERQSEIKRSRENYDKMTAEQTAAREQQMKGIEKAFNDAALKVQDTNPVFKKREGDHAWNTEVEKRLEMARNLFFGKGVKPEQVIQASLDAAALPSILSGYEAMYNENERLKAQVAELSKASPTIQSHSQPSDGSPQPVPVKVGMRPDDVTRAWVKSVTAEQ